MSNHNGILPRLPGVLSGLICECSSGQGTLVHHPLHTPHFFPLSEEAISFFSDALSLWTRIQVITRQAIVLFPQKLIFHALARKLPWKRHRLRIMSIQKVHSHPEHKKEEARNKASLRMYTINDLMWSPPGLTVLTFLSSPKRLWHFKRIGNKSNCDLIHLHSPLPTTRIRTWSSILNHGVSVIQ